MSALFLMLLLVQNIAGDVGAVGSNAPEHFLVQPYIHLGIIAANEIGRAAEFLGEFDAGILAGVNAEHFEHIHDRDFPIEA